jgi:VNT family MFS transporter (synaptic vesicle glycoprotein 2)
VLFQIVNLVDETKVENLENPKHGGHITANRNKIQALREGLQQIKPLCFAPHLKHIILVCSIQSLYMLRLVALPGKSLQFTRQTCCSINTLRLWFPQIFQSISDYKYYNNGTTASLCTMLEMLNPSTETNVTCHVVSMNTVIVSQSFKVNIFFAFYTVGNELYYCTQNRTVIGHFTA